MKRILSLLLILLLVCVPALAENADQARADSGFVGSWIETEGFGKLTVRADGTATMDYDTSNLVYDFGWELTEDGAWFTDGMWYHSPMTLADENTLSVNDGWMVFRREGITADLPEMDLSGLDPVPVGDAGIPYLGTWTADSVEAEGVSMPAAMLGLDMTLTFTADGLVTIDDGLEVLPCVWSVEYGVAVVDGMLLTLDAEGRLVMEDEGAKLFFTLQAPPAGEEEPSGTEEPAEEPSGEELSDEELLLLLMELMAASEGGDLTMLPENLQAYVGQWHLCYCATGGLTGDLRTMGITGMLTLYADGTGILSGLADEEGAWYEADGIVRFGEAGTPLTLLGDAETYGGQFLQYGSTQGGYMIFHEDGEAVWDPALLTAAEAAANTSGSPADAEARTGIRYVCTSCTTGGFTGDASILGAEYAVTFHSNGMADFTMAGVALPPLPYTVTDEGAYAIDYFGNALTCVPTEAGFDMDYYGAMILHFVPET